MFKRGSMYYVMVGKDCCYCVGGSNAMVMMAASPKGPWSYAGDVGSVVGHTWDKHDPHNFITNAQVMVYMVMVYMAHYSMAHSCAAYMQNPSCGTLLLS